MIDEAIKLDLLLVESYLQPHEISSFSEKVLANHHYMIDATCNEDSLLGWHDYPLQNQHALLFNINELATEVKIKANLFIVIGGWFISWSLKGYLSR